MIPIKLYIYIYTYIYIYIFLYIYIFVHSINMPNINQNNEIKHINKEISLLQDRLEIKEKVEINFTMG